jgi:hypothetical protein
VSFDAKDASCVISVITCEGQDCQLDTIGTCADITSGRVDVVDPSKMEAAMKHALGPATVASNVRMSLLGPRGCVIRADWNDPSKAFKPRGGGDSGADGEGDHSGPGHSKRIVVAITAGAAVVVDDVDVSVSDEVGAEMAVAVAALGCVTEDRTLTCEFECPYDVFGSDDGAG